MFFTYNSPVSYIVLLFTFNTNLFLLLLEYLPISFFRFTVTSLQLTFPSIFFIVATTLPNDSYLWVTINYPDSCPCKSAIFTHKSAVTFSPTPLFIISPDIAVSAIPPYSVSYTLLRVAWRTWGNSATFIWSAAKNVRKIRFILLFRYEIHSAS